MTATEQARAGAVAPKHVAGVGQRRVSLNLFGIPLGLAGFAAAWSAAVTDLGAPSWPEEVLFGASSALWVVFTVVYIVNGIRGAGVFRADLHHPLAGPFAAYIPLIAILLAGHYSAYDFAVFGWVCAAAIAALAVVAAQLVAHWFNGHIELDSVHPGYFIPVVAGANVASIGFSEIHAPQAALGAFGAGLFFWLAIGVVVIVRLFIGGPLPAPLKPSQSAFLAAAATSNLAWIVAHPGPLDETQMILTGILVIMLLVQGVLLGEYRKLPFSGSWWIFTFPLASTTNYAIRWMATVRVPGWEAWGWSILGVTSAFLLFVAARTIIRLIRPPTTS